MPNRPAATVLIVEDSASDRESFKRHLQRNNEYAFRFVEASCGEEGLAAYRQLKPDCVLLDYSLPDTDGLQFLSSIQATSPARKVPVVMLTGQGTSSVAVEAIRSGAVDYLVKSKLNADSLNAAVTSAIGTRADRAEPPKPCYHVLIIDDSATDAERYRRLLKDTGRERFEFSEAQTGADGLEAFDRHRPDCVLLDYNLPDFDGLEFLQTLAEEQGRKSQPMPVIVMLTGQGSEAVAVEAMKRGAQDYIVKDSLSRETLHRSVSTAIEKHKLQSRLIDKEREFEQFCYAVAHDLQAPLRRTRQFCGLLRKSTGDTLDASSKAFMALVESNVESLHTMLKDLLTYYSSDRLEGHRAPVDMNAVAQNVLGVLTEEIRGRGAKIAVGKLPVIFGYGSALTHLLQNLIDNAIKYNQSGEPQVSIDGLEEQRAWTFSVRDNGIGIDKSAIRRVFEPFQRAVSREDYSGTGLGLAICEKVVKLHGGTIWVESQPGAGTTFHFSIPRDVAA